MDLERASALSPKMEEVEEDRFPRPSSAARRRLMSVRQEERTLGLKSRIISKKGNKNSFIFLFRPHQMTLRLANALVTPVASMRMREVYSVVESTATESRLEEEEEEEETGEDVSFPVSPPPPEARLLKAIVH